MTAGRKRKPVELQLVLDRGDASAVGKGRKVMATVMPAMPVPPDHLEGYALAEWNHICGALFRCGVLTEIDGRGLAMYCQAYGRWKAAEEAIQKQAADDPENGGLVVVTASGNIIQSPFVGIANVAMGLAMKYAAEYGLTPSSRARLGIASEAVKSDPSAAYFT